MNSQKELHTPEFQSLVKQVETALAQAASDAQKLAEQTNTPLIRVDQNKDT